jgi:hypothetical protein
MINVPNTIKLQNEEHWKKAVTFAEVTGQEESLQKALDTLDRIAQNTNKQVLLGWDFAPYSFTFMVGNLQGGLIYHGDHDRGGDGGAPTYSVNLSPETGWRLHT